MPETLTYSNHYKYALKKKLIDESADTIRALLMRSGFTFNKDDHAQLVNIKTNTGAIALTWATADSSVSRGSGSFVTDGFVVGNQCTSDDASNPGPFTVATVTALKITFNEAVVNSSATKTLTSDDELTTGNGYTQNTKSVGTVTVTEDDTDNRCDSTFPTITWTASGGNIGPTPSCIVYDVTADVIICCLDFGGEITKSPPDSLNIGNGTLRLA